VTLTEGSSAGQSGTVLQVEERIASVLIENVNQEIKCLVNTLNIYVEAGKK
jgi:ribosomal protein L24